MPMMRSVLVATLTAHVDFQTVQRTTASRQTIVRHAFVLVQHLAALAGKRQIFLRMLYNLSVALHKPIVGAVSDASSRSNPLRVVVGNRNRRRGRLRHAFLCKATFLSVAGYALSKAATKRVRFDQRTKHLR